MKPALVTNPVEHAAKPDSTLWAKWEIQLFLEQYLVHPKDFMKMGAHFPHKNMTQLIQFYYNFKWVFDLKKFVLDL